jgi:hypothetical protein
VGEPTDAHLWRSVEVTVRDVLLPEITDSWARLIALQLVGMARWASGRPPEEVEDGRIEELASALDRLADNPLVAARWILGDRTPSRVLDAVSRVLSDAVDHDDAGGEAIRRELRPIVVRQLDDELTRSSVMLPYFRGQMPDA